MNNEMTTDNMSNEEVIEVLKGIVFNGFDRTTSKEREALDLAIKALEERPQGEWERHDEWRSGEYIGGFYHVNCPCEDGYYSKWETNFCPNCGLPMKKGGAE